VRWWLLLTIGCGRIAFEAGEPDAKSSCDPCLGGPAPIVDDFNRADGPIGGAWIGDTTLFSIRGGQLVVAGQGAIMRPETRAIDEWVELTLVQSIVGQEIGLIVQAQGIGYSALRIEGEYHEDTPESHVHVAVMPFDGYSTLALSLPPGTRFRAVDHQGLVSLYADGVLVHEAQAVAAAPTAPGLIGIGGSYAVANAIVDDFGGGACGCP